MEVANDRSPGAAPLRSLVAGFGVDVTDVDRAGAALLARAHVRAGGYAVLFNTHMCSEAHRNPGLQLAVETASWVFADGRPIYWMQRLTGNTTARQVRGAELMWALLRAAQRERLSVGIFGSSDRVLALLRQRLAQAFPRLDLVLLLSPAFGEWSAEQNATYLQQIEAARPALLFVALGCPRQELWMSATAARLDTVMLGIGAAVDFLAATKPEAPRWMQRLGLEWLHRLLSEPRRLWRRYLFHNLHFLALAVREMLRRDNESPITRESR
jgi:N-acetylglucosaminyldiphosphoundecaprenol N-acetyl-beta-D-mannosaminyltransferase